jgi:hypothetical protein
MIRINTILLTAALSLIMSALTAQAANTQLATTQAAKTSTIPISFLPFPTITAPGSYKVTSNLTCPADVTGITINSSKAGAIVVDLGGFTLNAYPNMGSSVSGIQVTGNSTSSSITIQNGSINNFNVGLGAGVIEDPEVTFWSNIHIKNIEATSRRAGVSFAQINSSTIDGCTFHGGNWGIQDQLTNTGNSYNNNRFTGFEGTALEVTFVRTLELQDCHFVAPTN